MVVRDKGFHSLSRKVLKTILIFKIFSNICFPCPGSSCYNIETLLSLQEMTFSKQYSLVTKLVGYSTMNTLLNLPTMIIFGPLIQLKLGLMIFRKSHKFTSYCTTTSLSDYIVALHYRKRGILVKKCK